MDVLLTKFKSLLWYMPYIREDKTKVHYFMSSLPAFMEERLEFDNVKTMDEARCKGYNHPPKFFPAPNFGASLESFT